MTKKVKFTNPIKLSDKLELEICTEVDEETGELVWKNPPPGYRYPDTCAECVGGKSDKFWPWLWRCTKFDFDILSGCYVCDRFERQSSNSLKEKK